MFTRESRAIGGVLRRRRRTEFARSQVVSAKKFKLCVVFQNVVLTVSTMQMRTRDVSDDRDGDDDEPLPCPRF